MHIRNNKPCCRSFATAASKMPFSSTSKGSRHHAKPGYVQYSTRQGLRGVVAPGTLTCREKLLLDYQRRLKQSNLDVLALEARCKVLKEALSFLQMSLCSRSRQSENAVTVWCSRSSCACLAHDRGMCLPFHGHTHSFSKPLSATGQWNAATFSTCCYTHAMSGGEG